MKKYAILAGLLCALAGCGGSVRIGFFNYQGALTGIDCSSHAIRNMQARYTITIDAFSPGSNVTLVDQAGIWWTGTMLTPSSFQVGSFNPFTNVQTWIVISNVNSAGAHVDSVTTCVASGCCTTLSGDVFA